MLLNQKELLNKNNIVVEDVKPVESEPVEEVEPEPKNIKTVRVGGMWKM